MIWCGNSDGTAKSEADVTAVLASLAGVASKALKSGGQVPLSGIGKLTSARRDARQARNPSTGALVDVPAKTVSSSRSRRILPKRSFEGGAAVKDGQPASRLGNLRPPPVRSGLTARVSRIALAV